MIISKDAYKRLAKPKKKYGNRTTKDKRGIDHPSALEAAVANVLIDREDAGEISELRYWPSVTLIEGNGQRITHKADFGAIEKGEQTYWEAKGCPDDTWLLKKKLWKICKPATLWLYTGTYKRLIGPELVVKK